MTTEFTGPNADYLNQCTRKAKERERDPHLGARSDAQDWRKSRWKAWDIQQRRATWQRTWRETPVNELHTGTESKERTRPL